MPTSKTPRNASNRTSAPGRRRKRGRSHGRENQSTSKRFWSASVMKYSNALDLDPGVFQLKSPRRIAASLKRSAEKSRHKKGTPYQSAMSMLNFYINRGGKNLETGRKKVLQRAKAELRKAFGRDESRE